MPPVISPLDEHGGVDAPALAGLVEHILGGGGAGLFVLGGCGEGSWLTAEQRSGVVRAAVAGSPYYFQVDAAAQRRHIEALLDATDLPVLLYNIPPSTHHVLTPETVAALGGGVHLKVVRRPGDDGGRAVAGGAPGCSSSAAAARGPG